MSIGWWIWRSGQGSIAIQRQMASMFVVVANILIENLPQPFLV